MPTWIQFNFQDSNSPLIEEFFFFHDQRIIILIFIIYLVMSIFFFIVSNNLINKNLIQGQVIEWVWTLIPGLILLTIVIPSLSLLYIFDEQINYSLRIKSIGHQWFWRYEILNYKDFKLNNFEFDSYINTENFKNKFRLLDTDNRLIIPINTPIQILVSSNDVIHAWSIPSLGLKVDAIPGRLNLLSLFSYRPGIFFGQCSEICGANHRFIPIILEIINSADFYLWLLNN